MSATTTTTLRVTVTQQQQAEQKLDDKTYGILYVLELDKKRYYVGFHASQDHEIPEFWTKFTGEPAEWVKGAKVALIYDTMGTHADVIPLTEYYLKKYGEHNVKGVRKPSRKRSRSRKVVKVRTYQVCITCGLKGHRSARCPQKPA